VKSFLRPYSQQKWDDTVTQAPRSLAIDSKNELGPKKTIWVWHWEAKATWDGASPNFIKRYSLKPDLLRRTPILGLHLNQSDVDGAISGIPRSTAKRPNMMWRTSSWRCAGAQKATMPEHSPILCGARIEANRSEVTGPTTSALSKPREKIEKGSAPIREYLGWCSLDVVPLGSPSSLRLPGKILQVVVPWAR